QVRETTLRSLARQVRDDLISDPDLSQISIAGLRDPEISIEVTEEALQRYALSFADVMAAVSRGSVDLPAGTIRTRDEEITVRTLGQRHTAAEFESLVVISAPDGTLIRLNQIATVRDTFEESPKRGWFNGQPGVMIGLYKTPALDTSTICRKVRHYVQERQTQLPEGITMSVWADTSRGVDGRIAMLGSNGLWGMALVLLALTLFLDLRLSFWVALGIPVSFAGALIVLALMGQTLNMISLLGLIMATGIIVDDAIVVAENIHARKSGAGDPAQAAIDGTADMALPVLGSSATTIAAFAPLLFVSGVLGKFISVLPIAMIGAIVASSLEAFAILPAHLRYGPSSGSASNSRLARLRRVARSGLDRALAWTIRRAYGPLVGAAVRNRLITLSVAAASLALIVGLVAGGRTALVVFPEGESQLLRARVRFPEGMPASATAEAARRLERAAWAINDDPNLDAEGGLPPVVQVSTVTGEWPGFWTDTGSHLCEVTLELAPAEERDRTGEEILDAWRAGVGTIHDAVSVEMARQELRPVGKPVEIRLLGQDLEQLRRAADEVRDKLATYAGIYEIEDTLIPGKRELRVSLKPVARALGLTVADLASQLRAGFHGGEALRVLRDREEIKVQVRYPGQDRRSLADVDRMRIRTARGEEIPFTEAADVELVRGYSTLWRQDGKRRVRVWAEVDERLANAEQILADMNARFLPDLARRYGEENHQAGFTYSLDGPYARMRESVGSLLDGFALAMVVIYGLLASILRSYAQPLIIMATIPLGMVGAVLGHVIMGSDLTMMSIFGVVALSGVVVNDALVLIVRINRLIRSGQPVVAAVLEAGRSRFRAVVLTTVTTVAGLLPLLIERSSQAQQLTPMVIALTFGLIFATVLTLLVVPAMYLATNDLRRVVRWLVRGGDYPTAETVEQGEVTSAG
ncbi:MAG: efflux RND transporter permease subunit, partial [bacterium]|nr:efflux RND transporter permease subunit [bacterium]